MRKLRTGSVVHGKLPKGCILCQKGKKLVLFITGLCSYECFYCPVSLERRNRDEMYANDTKVKKCKDVLKEIYNTDAMGTGITGGEPLLRFRRVIYVIKLLKEHLGYEHHIHLYTNGIGLNLEKIRLLEKSGLDEIRIHLTDTFPLYLLEKFRRNLKKTKIGIEIPALPNHYSKIKKWLIFAEKIGLNFLNLNELEFTEANYLSLLERGYKLRSNSLIAAEKSEEIALKLIRYAEDMGFEINIHFCPTRVKDRYQTTLRFFQRACNVAKKYENVSDEGSIIKAMLIGNQNILKEVIKRRIPSSLIRYISDNCIYASAFLAFKYEDIFKRKDIRVMYIESLPIDEQMDGVIKNLL